MSKNFTLDGIGDNTELGDGGPRIKDSSGTVQVRNAADSAFAKVQAGAGTAADDLVTKTQLDAVAAAGVPSSRTLTAGNGLTGGGDLSIDRTFDVVANADGSIVVNTNDVQVGVLASDAQHGTRGGGTLHSAATGGTAGFMSSTDKTKLDSFSPETSYFLVDGSRDITGGFDVAVASPTVTIGDGTGTPMFVLDKSAGGEGRFQYHDAGVMRWESAISGTEHLEFRRYNSSGVFQDNSLKLWASGAVTMEGTVGLDITNGPLDVGGLATFDGDATFDSSAPEIFVGDGSGSPKLYFDKNDAGFAEVWFRNNESGTQQQRWILSHRSDESLAFQRYNSAGTFQDFTIQLNADGSVDVANTLTADTLVGTAEVTGILYREEYVIFNDSGSAAKQYVPFRGTQSPSVDIADTGNWIVAGYDGELFEIIVVGENSGAGPTPGSTVIGFHKNFNGTATETDTVNMALNTTPYTFTFSSSTFDKGDRLSISFDPTNNPQRISMVLKFKYDTRT